MSADLLRRAATRLRERAEWFGSKSPWKVEDGRGYPQRVVDDGAVLYAETYDGTLWAGEAGTAEYIALVHPPVALALADWLDDEAARWDHEVEFAKRVVTFPGSREPAGWPVQKFPHALAVARAVLREPEGGDRT